MHLIIRKQQKMFAHRQQEIYLSSKLLIYKNNIKVLDLFVRT